MTRNKYLHHTVAVSFCVLTVFGCKKDMNKLMGKSDDEEKTTAQTILEQPKVVLSGALSIASSVTGSSLRLAETTEHTVVGDIHYLEDGEMKSAPLGGDVVANAETGEFEIKIPTSTDVYVVLTDEATGQLTMIPPVAGNEGDAGPSVVIDDTSTAAANMGLTIFQDNSTEGKEFLTSVVEGSGALDISALLELGAVAASMEEDGSTMDETVKADLLKNFKKANMQNVKDLKDKGVDPGKNFKEGFAETFKPEKVKEQRENGTFNWAAMGKLAKEEAFKKAGLEGQADDFNPMKQIFSEFSSDKISQNAALGPILKARTFVNAAADMINNNPTMDATTLASAGAMMKAEIFNATKPDEFAKYAQGIKPPFVDSLMGAMEKVDATKLGDLVTTQLLDMQKTNPTLFQSAQKEFTKMAPPQGATGASSTSSDAMKNNCLVMGGTWKTDAAGGSFCEMKTLAPGETPPPPSADALAQGCKSSGGTWNATTKVCQPPASISTATSGMVAAGTSVQNYNGGLAPTTTTGTTSTGSTGSSTGSVTQNSSTSGSNTSTTTTGTTAQATTAPSQQSSIPACGQVIGTIDAAKAQTLKAVAQSSTERLKFCAASNCATYSQAMTAIVVQGMPQSFQQAVGALSNAAEAGYCKY